MSEADGSSGPLAVAVLASGGGSNLQALIDRLNVRGSSDAQVSLVVSDREDAGALARATRAGIPAAVLPMKGRDSGEVGEALLEMFEKHGIGLIALAGFLRLVPDGVVERYRGRIVNIHPALLPAFGGAGYYGLRVHRAVLDSGATVTGPTVHLVDEEYDSGRILAQWPVPVRTDDTPESLAARVLEVEHVLYPVVLERLATELREAAAARPDGSAPRAAVPNAAAGFASSGRAPTHDEVAAALGFGRDVVNHVP